MITELTEQQTQMLDVYRDKWIKIGLDTSRVGRGTCRKISDYFFEKIEGKQKKPVIVMSNPLYAWYAVCFFSQYTGSIIEQEQAEPAKRQERNYQTIDKKCLEEIIAQINSQVKLDVVLSLSDFAKEKIFSFVYPYIDGSFFASYFSFYDYIEEVLGITYDCEHYAWYKSTTEINLFYPLDNICICSDKPEKISMVDKRLHCDGGPSIRYTDGYSFWNLNGVKVTQEIAETPAGKLDPKLILNEQNMDVQREIIKKIGAERVLKKLGAKCMDTWMLGLNGKKYKYELLTLEAGQMKRKYMYYESAVLPGVFHAMSVPPEIETAKKGFCWFKELLKREEIENISEEVLDERIKAIKWLC